MEFLRRCGAILIGGWRRKACRKIIMRTRVMRTTFRTQRAKKTRVMKTTFRRPGIRKIRVKGQRTRQTGGEGKSSSMIL